MCLRRPVYPPEDDVPGVVAVDPRPRPVTVDNSGAGRFQAGDDPNSVVGSQGAVAAVRAVWVRPALTHKPVEPLR